MIDDFRLQNEVEPSAIHMDGELLQPGPWSLERGSSDDLRLSQQRESEPSDKEPIRKLQASYKEIYWA